MKRLTGQTEGIPRDANGTPILQAEDERDLFRKLGYSHARDRRGQMLFMRILGRAEYPSYWTLPKTV